MTRTEARARARFTQARLPCRLQALDDDGRAGDAAWRSAAEVSEPYLLLYKTTTTHLLRCLEEQDIRGVDLSVRKKKLVALQLQRRGRGLLLASSALLRRARECKGYSTIDHPRTGTFQPSSSSGWSGLVVVAARPQPSRPAPPFSENRLKWKPWLRSRARPCTGSLSLSLSVSLCAFSFRAFTS